MDGKAKSGSDYSGEIGKALKNCTNLPINSDFVPLKMGDGLIELPDKIVNDLSTEHFILYLLIQSVWTGHIKEKDLMRLIGPICLLRWQSCSSHLFPPISYQKGDNLPIRGLETEDSICS